jgi:Lon protease-like protein
MISRQIAWWNMSLLPWNAEDLTFDEARFTGNVRLFPLPDLVMFPHVVQPLHIFEPRYREMLNDALDGDGLIAMSILAPGWENDYDGRPALLPHVCVGKVVTHQRLDNGRYNLMLLGMRRGRIVGEMPATRSFRQAEVVLIDDVYPDAGDAGRDAVQAALAAKFQDELPLAQNAKTNDGPVQELLSSEVPLGVLTDLVSFALPLPVEVKRTLLAEVNVDVRARVLLDAMGEPVAKAKVRPAQGIMAPRGPYPPKFSVN